MSSENAAIPRAQIPLLSHAARVILLTAFFLGLSGAIIAFVILIIRWNFAFSHYGPAAVSQWTATPLLSSMTLTLVWLIAITVWALRRKHRAVVNEAGVMLELGRRRRLYGWDQLKDLNLSATHYGLPAWKWASRSAAQLTTTRGERLRFHGRLDELERFTTTIKHYLYPRRLKAYRQALEQDESIGFGPLRCSRDGLTYRDEKYPWHRVSRVTLEKGFLSLALELGSSSKRIRLPVKEIPNPDLCAELLKRIEY